MSRGNAGSNIVYARPVGGDRPPTLTGGYGNAGDEVNPYLISTFNHLRWLSEWNGRKDFTDGWFQNTNTPIYFRQVDDIDASESQYLYNGRGLRPIGHNLNPSDNLFVGVYDGQGHTISNLVINAQDHGFYPAGLFSHISGTNTVIRNVNLVNVTVKGNTIAGGIVGEMSNGAMVENCSVVNGDIFGFGNVGGIAGLVRINSTIQRSFSTGTIKGNVAGGVAGNLISSTVQNSYSAADVSGAYIGGIVGMTMNSSIMNTYSIGNSSDIAGTFHGGIGGYALSISGNTVSNNFWDLGTSGVTNGFGYIAINPVNTIGRTTAQMKQQSTYTGWDFSITGPWGIHSTINNGYPYLRVFHQAVVSISHTMHDFGNTYVSQTSPAVIFTISNIGGNPLNINSIALSGANAGDFSLSASPSLPTPSSPWNIAVGANRQFQATFSPSASGQRTATITITDNLGRILEIVSISDSMENTVIEEDTYRNSRSNISPSRNSDFRSERSIISDDVSINDEENRATHTISLTGMGVNMPAELIISPLPGTEINFGNVLIGETSSTQVITITNSGGSPANITSIFLSGSNAGNFSHTGVPTTINAGSPYTFHVMFSPSLPAGNKTATLNITDNLGRTLEINSISERSNLTSIVIDDNMSIANRRNNDNENNRANHTFLLSGVAITQGKVSINPDSHNFDNTTVGQTSPSQTFTVTNTGGTSLTINSITKTGSHPNDFNVSYPNGVLPWTMAPNVSRAFAVSFTPTDVGNRNATITITDNLGRTMEINPFSEGRQSNDLVVTNNRRDMSVRESVSFDDNLRAAHPVTVSGIGVVALPGQVILSSPANGATGQPLRPTLTWQQPTSGGAVIGYYVYRGTTENPSTNQANLVYFVQNATTLSWTHTSDLSYNTTYHWQVVAFNANGNGTASASWSFTTLMDVPGQVTLSSPTNGATGQPLRPTLSWQQPASGGTVTGYYVYRGTSVNPSSNEANLVYTATNATTTSWTHTSDLNYNTTYHWQVVAFNATGNGTASDSWSFTTLMDVPGQVTLSSPANGATDRPIRPALTWQQPTSGGSVVGYYVYRGTSTNPASNEANLVYTAPGASTLSWVHTSDLEHNTTYHWQVVAFNATGNGTASASWSFTTLIAVPGQVTLSSPTNGATGQPLRPTLTWQQPTTGGAVTGYYVYSGTSSNQSNLIYIAPNATTLSWTHTADLSYNTTYHWHVVAYNSTGNGVASDSWSFTTLIAPPGQVSLVSPINDATNQPVRPSLTWQQPTTGGDVTGYYVYSGSSANPYNSLNPENNRVTTITGATNTSWTYESDLASQSQYHWQVVAYNSTGLSPASESWTFIIQTVSDTDNVSDIVATNLIGNYPNPFNPETTIKFDLKHDAHVLIEIFSIRGQKVQTLVNNNLGAGNHQVIWNGSDNSGQQVGSGIYFYRMTTNEYSSIKRMVLMK